MAFFKLKGLNKNMESNTYLAPSDSSYRFWNPKRDNFPAEYTEVKNPMDIEHFRRQTKTFEEIPVTTVAAAAAKNIVDKAVSLVPGKKKG